MPGVRIEWDGLGEQAVPADALWGAQTQRAVDNFPLGGDRTIGHYPPLIDGLMAVKRAAAEANGRAGELTREIADAIARAAVVVLEQRRYDQFPVHRLHGGGGTSANMNANEVLANLAEETLGGRRGEYRLVHPNDHVNRNQSTNDVYPTACHVAIVAAWRARRAPIAALIAALAGAGERWAEVPRITRTCLQDAVEGTWRELFAGAAAVLRRSLARIDVAVDALHAVPLGGGVVGQLDRVAPAYAEAVIPRLAAAAGDDGWHRTTELAAAYQGLDDMVAVSAQLDLAARSVVKIANDLRLLASGPEAGFGELRLPPVQPGSSAMPGKLNPVVPEFAIQLCLQIAGLHAASCAAVDHGELDLNVWESLVASNLLDAVDLLATAAGTLAARCVVGLEVDEPRSRAHADTLIPRLARLMSEHGYARISERWRQAGGDLERLERLLDRSHQEEG